MKFYLVAMIFILFDVEAIFLYPWAFVFRDLRLFGFVEMLLYIAILLVGYIYLWKKGRARLESPERSPGSDLVETQNLEKDPIIRKLREWDPQAVAEVIYFRGEMTVVVPREHLRRAAEFLSSDPGLRFTFLSDITAVDRFPDRAALRAELPPAFASSGGRGCACRCALAGRGSGRDRRWCRCGRRRTGTSAKFSICSACASKDIRICGAF